MGGRIRVHSELGHGSRFHVVVPFGERAVSSPAPAADTSALRGRTVLVVDDNVTNCRILREVLQQWGMAPTVVHGGPDALDALQVALAAGDPFPLVLLDQQMPDMSGTEVAAAIQAAPALGSPLVLMLSSTDQQPPGQAVEALGIGAWLAKPVRRAMLLREILIGLGRSGPLSAARLAPAAVPSRALRVLLAEDNPMNTRLMQAMLDSRGHLTTAVSTGRRRGGRSDGRCRLRPRADGCPDAADGRPGSDGSDSGTRARPATAIADYRPHRPCHERRSRRLSRGRRGRLSLQADSCGGAVRAGRAPHWRDAPARRGGRALSRQPSFSAEDLLARVGGDRPLLAELVTLFAQDAPGAIAALQRTLADADAAGLQQASHRLRGALLNFGADTAASAALEVETLARAGTLDDASAPVQRLVKSVTQLLFELDQFASVASKIDRVTP